ncbi:MAG: class I SAM-dependent methyltransferase [Candidatus Omnitrophota bacterium]
MSSKIRELKLKEHLRKKIDSYYESTYKKLSGIPQDKYVGDVLSIGRAEEEISLLKKKIGIDIEGKKLLEIGSGFGSFIINSRMNHNVLSSGVEPDETCYSVSKELIKDIGLPEDIINKAVGEDLPYKDNVFDIVYSSNSVEHVRDPRRVFQEATRVLKPGGFLFFVIPNYASWWEGHYGMIWLPNMPKGLAKLYVRLFGRDPSFIDSLQFLTLKKVKEITSSFDNSLDVLDLGWDVWEHRLRTIDFSGWAYLYRLKDMLKMMHKLRLIEPVIFLGKRFDWLTPIIVLAKKT